MGSGAEAGCNALLLLLLLAAAPGAEAGCNAKSVTILTQDAAAQATVTVTSTFASCQTCPCNVKASAKVQVLAQVRASFVAFAFFLRMLHELAVEPCFVERRQGSGEHEQRKSGWELCRWVGVSRLVRNNRRRRRAVRLHLQRPGAGVRRQHGLLGGNLDSGWVRLRGSGG